MIEESCDVVIVGGGPAGATCATYLSKLGKKVIVLEKEIFPRHCVGESLLPSMMPILDDFGLLDAVEACGFPKKTGGTFIWGKNDEPWDVFFSNNPFLPYPYAYHVDRAVFDKLLLDHAISEGADVRIKADVKEVLRDGDSPDARVTGVVYIDSNGEKHTVNARFVVDASGRPSVIGRQVTNREYDDKMRQVAFYTYYKDVQGPEELREGHVIIESCRWGWFWYIPVHGTQLGDASVGLVSGQEFKDDYGSMGKQAFFERALEDAPYMQKLLGPQAKRVQEFRAVVDWAYTCDRSAGPGFYLAGDSAAFLDPMLSTGVSVAMLAGYSTSVCIHSVDEGKASEEEAAEFYHGNYQRMYEITRDFLHYFYACNGREDQEAIFWKARKTLQMDDSMAACQAFCFLVNTVPANPHPALDKQIHMYLQFMDQLEHPLDEMENTDGLHARQKKREAYQEKHTFDEHIIPEVNGELDTSWVIDGTGHLLRPIQGVAYDSERPIFSSTSSWLLGRNLHEVSEAEASVLHKIDGKLSWGEILNIFALEEGSDRDTVRAQLLPVLAALSERGLLLEKKRSGDSPIALAS
jgi:FAD-dependent halogenase